VNLLHDLLDGLLKLDMVELHTLGVPEAARARLARWSGQTGHESRPKGRLRLNRAVRLGTIAA
jgi:hypothetical protein